MEGEKRSPNHLPGNFDERVFIGGNYNVAGNLRAIRRYVEQAGFVPIFPLDDYDIPRDQIHDWDIRLLHNCKYAIFDVSVPAGELMEIERALTFKTEPYWYFKSRNQGKQHLSRSPACCAPADTDFSGIVIQAIRLTLAKR